MGKDVRLVDGNEGTARQLMRKLNEMNLRQEDENHKGRTIFFTSAPNEAEALGHMRNMLRIAQEL